MLLSLTTTHRPATDLGFLLLKHPDRVHTFQVPNGMATVVFPAAGDDSCTMALLVEGEGVTYAASSLLSVALNRAFRTALRGESRDRPELATTPIPLEIRIPVLRCKGGVTLAHKLFEPLGWSVVAQPIALDEQIERWGDSDYVDLTLTGRLTVKDALSHLYLLIPVLDDAKHYWVGPDEVEKMMRAGEGWLTAHPERPLIIKRYLAHQRALVSKVIEEPPAEEKPKPLNHYRRQAVLAALERTGATRVVDLGCGGGALLGELVRNPRYTEIVGAEVSARSLEVAQRRLRLDRLPDRQRARIKLLQTSVTYLDDRLQGYDAAVLMEVIEHVDPPRLAALQQAVFGHAAPHSVIVTTPNSEYNVRYESLPRGKFRHIDHRFEFTRSEFSAWAASVASAYGYRFELSGIGEGDPELGHPTQMAVFTK